MTLDARGREAGRAFRAEIERMRTTGTDRASIERFERVLAGRHRGQRIGAGLLAAVVAVAGIFFVMRMFRGAERSAPAASKVPGGLILYGDWDASLQQAEWFTVRPDGSAPHDLRVSATCAVWFPDGTRILITNDAAAGAGTPLRPAVVDPNGSNLQPLDATRNPDLNLGCGEVSPDGTRIALEGFGQGGHAELDGIYSVRASDGGGLVRLLEGPVAPPRYSPDGTRLSFFDTKEGVSPTGSGALFVMGSDGAGLVRITPWGYAFADHAWSPDGRWIVFQRPYGQMYLVRPDGSDLHRVPLNLPPGTGALNPEWSPDGTWIVFSLQRPEQAEIYMARPDGTSLRKVAGAPDVQAQHPDWRAPSS
jgi:dipeptidyl aminopeptidase/acylaminoacyl peptidase